LSSSLREAIETQGGVKVVVIGGFPSFIMDLEGSYQMLTNEMVLGLIEV